MAVSRSVSAGLMALALLVSAPVSTPAQRNDGSIVIFTQTNFRGIPQNINRETPNRRPNTARSVTINRGVWELCEDPAFAGRCRTFRDSSPDIRRDGLRRIGSARQIRGAAVPAPMVITLFERDLYRGTSWTTTTAVNDTARRSRVRSVTIGRGVWELCEGRNFSGRCVILDRSVSDLRTRGFNDRIGSVRPARQAR